MTLDQLKKIHDDTGIDTDKQISIIYLLNQQRFDFGVKELPEIPPYPSSYWFSRKAKILSQEQLDANSWNYYKQKIQQWIILIELHETSLSLGEKLKRFVGKHKWIYFTSTTVITAVVAIWKWYDMIANWLDTLH